MIPYGFILWQSAYIWLWPVAKDEAMFAACKWKEVMGILLVDISTSSMMALQVAAISRFTHSISTSGRSKFKHERGTRL
jgi:hypothetical protein|eukprot:scaffold3341_cov270-Chaetoceros_neogracile.AAC.25